MLVAPTSELEQEWQTVQDLLRDEVGETAYTTWLQPLAPAEIDGDRVVIGAPTPFLRDWVVAHYADRIRSAWHHVNPRIRKVALDVRQDARERAPAAAAADARPAEAASTVAAPAAASAEAAKPAAPSRSEEEEALLDAYSAPIDPRFTFDNFVVAKSNDFAFAAAKRVAASDRPPFNPLFLYSGVGLGKTHLMHAIAWEVRRQDPRRRVVYLSAEKFMYQFVRALTTNSTLSFKDLFRSVDLLMVDDVQFIGGKNNTQEEFFHTFNELIERGSQIVISADRSPSALEDLEERVRSRLSWGLVADIHPTSYELRLGILQTKAAKIPNVVVPEELLQFLAERITSNVRELEGALNRVVHQSTLLGRPLSMETAQDVLRDVLRANEKRITIEEIQKAVVAHYSLKLADMQSKRRSRVVARPRQVAMYLAKQLTPRSLPEIGRRFGGRDHTTVMHAVKKVDELLAEDDGLARDVESLRRRLQG
ncbi:MAG: chromosomal replication initiator protein DnaA [Alphaproteobacteria bacterium]|jgi:chromosomal replication initiator protein|nr:chromosomal replication initiator protein DnaA [Alphaproteobacteria bacterium]